MNDRVNVAEAERWASAIGGAALAAWGLKQLRDERGPAGAMIAAAGASLIVRGATGHCPVYTAAGYSSAADDTRTALGGSRGVHVEQSYTIYHRSPVQLYAVWRRLEELPRFMHHLESVTRIDERRSRWVAKGPAGRRVEWDAEIINDVPNERIAWRTLPGADVVSAGSVSFKAAPGDRGTEVRVNLQYEPPGGKMGAVIAWLFGREPAQAIQEDVRRFKWWIEAGEIPTTEGQPRGRQSILNYD